MLLFGLVVSLSGSAQGSAQTFYVIPPPNGCDGVWAVDGTALFANCPGPYNYFVDPFGCANWMQPSFSGDTIFYPLCSLPCDLTLTCGDGSMVMCQTGGFTDVKELAEELALTLSQTTDLLQLHLNRPVPEARLTVYDLQGRLVLAPRLGGGDHWSLDRSVLSAGAVVVVLSTGAERLVRSTVLMP